MSIGLKWTQTKTKITSAGYDNIRNGDDVIKLNDSIAFEAEITN
jgi:hypothetical protein